MFEGRGWLILTSPPKGPCLLVDHLYVVIMVYHIYYYYYYFIYYYQMSLLYKNYLCTQLILNWKFRCNLNIDSITRKNKKKAQNRREIAHFIAACGRALHLPAPTATQTTNNASGGRHQVVREYCISGGQLAAFEQII